MFNDAQGRNILRLYWSHHSLISLILRKIEGLKLDMKEYISSAPDHTMGHLVSLQYKNYPAPFNEGRWSFSTEAEPLKLDLCVAAMTRGKNLSSQGMSPFVDGGITVSTLRGSVRTILFMV